MAKTYTKARLVHYIAPIDQLVLNAPHNVLETEEDESFFKLSFFTEVLDMAPDLEDPPTLQLERLQEPILRFLKSAPITSAMTLEERIAALEEQIPVIKIARVLTTQEPARFTVSETAKYEPLPTPVEVSVTIKEGGAPVRLTHAFTLFTSKVNPRPTGAIRLEIDGAPIPVGENEAATEEREGGSQRIVFGAADYEKHQLPTISETNREFDGASMLFWLPEGKHTIRMVAYQQESGGVGFGVTIKNAVLIAERLG